MRVPPGLQLLSEWIVEGPAVGEAGGKCGTQLLHGIAGGTLGEGVLGWGKVWELFAVQISLKEQMRVDAQGGAEEPLWRDRRGSPTGLPSGWLQRLEPANPR